jgi:hypothetical protein
LSSLNAAFVALAPFVAILPRTAEAQGDCSRDSVLLFVI